MSNLNPFVRGLILHQNSEYRIECYDYLQYMLFKPIFSYERDATLKQVQGIMKDLVQEQITARLLVPIVYLIECAQKFAETAEPERDPAIVLFEDTTVLWNEYNEMTRGPHD